MTRRLPTRLVLGIATAAVAVSGCATFDNTDQVADVGGTHIDAARFDPLADEYFTRGDVFGTAPEEDGRVDGEQTRFLLGAVVEQQLLRTFLDDQGVDVTELRQTYIDGVLGNSPAADLSQGFLDLIADVDEQFTSQALAQVDPPDIDSLRALYSQNPSSTGVVCVRHILVETEAEANDLLDELDEGADFAELAADRSIDPTAAEAGGAINNGDTECIPLQTMLQSFDPGFSAGALAAREGVPSDPIESSFGWHIILHRPWNEIAASVAAVHQPGTSGGFLFDGYSTTTEVDVDPRFGNWDPLGRAVVPAG